MYCYSDMVALEALKSSGGDTLELVNNHDMDPQNRQSRTVRLLVVDVRVNLNPVPIEPFSDLPHQIPSSIYHLWRLQ